MLAHAPALKPWYPEKLVNQLQNPHQLQHWTRYHRRWFRLLALDKGRRQLGMVITSWIAKVLTTRMTWGRKTSREGLKNFQTGASVGDSLSDDVPG